jgi:hypothetical protein
MDYIHRPSFSYRSRIWNMWAWRHITYSAKFSFRPDSLITGTDISQGSTVIGRSECPVSTPSRVRDSTPQRPDCFCCQQSPTQRGQSAGGVEAKSAGSCTPFPGHLHAVVLRSAQLHYLHLYVSATLNDFALRPTSRQLCVNAYMHTTLHEDLHAHGFARRPTCRRLFTKTFGRFLVTLAEFVSGVKWSRQFSRNSYSFWIK